MTLPTANSTTYPQRLRKAQPRDYTGEILTTASGAKRRVRKVLIEGTGVVVNVPAGVGRVNKPVDKFGEIQSGWRVVEQGKAAFFRDATTNGSVASRSLIEAVAMMYQIAGQPYDVVARVIDAYNDKEYFGKNVNTGYEGIEAYWGFASPTDSIPFLGLRYRVFGETRLGKAITVSLADTVGIQVAMEKLVTLRDNVIRLGVKDKTSFAALWLQVRTGNLRGHRVNLAAKFWNQLIVNRDARIEAREKQLRGV